MPTSNAVRGLMLAASFNSPNRAKHIGSRQPLNGLRPNEGEQQRLENPQRLIVGRGGKFLLLKLQPFSCDGFKRVCVGDLLCFALYARVNAIS